MIAHWAQWKWSNPILVKLPFVHGVTLFFVLSGFLISRILLQNGDEYDKQKLPKSKLVKSFYIRRFFRIFPIYYLLIFALYFMDYNNTREIFPWLVTYTSNIYQSITNEYVGEFNHFWSLAVEEQFYLFWPFLLLFVKRKHSLKVIVGAILTGLLSRVYLHIYVGKWMATSYFTLSCLPALAVGALLAYYNLYKPVVFKRIASKPLLYTAILLYLLSLYIQNYFELFWYKQLVDTFLFSLLSAIIIGIASTNGFKLFAKYILESKFVSYSGKISYGLYVYHLFAPALFYYVAPKLGIAISNKYTLFVALYLLTFIVSHFSWVLFESPINNLKKRVPYLGKNRI